MAKTKEELLAARAEREAEAQRVREAHDLRVLELEDRFSEELGKEGEAWMLVNRDNAAGEGPIVVKLGDPTHYKSWQAKPSGLEEQFAYVAPSVVYPEKAVFNALAVRRPELLGRCVIAMNKLFGFSEEVLKGKV